MEIFLISLLTLAASFVGTLTGFGASTIMLPIVVFFFPLPISLLFVGIIHWFNDVWKIILFRRGINWKLLLSFGAPGALASFIGARVVLVEPPEILTQALGGFLIGYFAFLSLEPKFKIPRTSLSQVLGGSLSGFLAGILGIGGAVRGAFLSAFNFPKEIYLFTSGVLALFIDTSRLLTYLYGGIGLGENLLWGLLIFIPVSFAGAEIAKRAVDKTPQKSFRKVVVFFLLLVGIKLLVFPS